MITVVIQIGNSDDKLTQNEWAHFTESMRQEIARLAHVFHFQGGSDWNAPWQNACWVCEVPTHRIDELKRVVAKRRESYGQDSAAFTIGTTEFV